ncbi:MAG: protein-ADP-ribose hydrolase [Lachnospiraceae bacterium]|nr:protein-ADP-ribose hydrolase [Lachnospiraceae bacterium]
MNQSEKRNYLIQELLKEHPVQQKLQIPNRAEEQKRLLRALFNVRMVQETSDEFLEIQDEYLKAEIAKKGITDYKSLSLLEPNIYLWKGDITTLQCDGIVNAANSQMLGCFCPNHGCIDNAIHTFAGIQLRAACGELMSRQGCEEPAGKAKITPAYNLPSKYVLHTVGPIVTGELTKTDCELLASCYSSCLELAVKHNIKSLAFCCISTGEFHFPNDRAAEIAVQTVRNFVQHQEIEVIFNVFKDYDYEIYRGLLGAGR